MKRLASLRRSFLEGFEELAHMPAPPAAPWGSAASVKVVRPGAGYTTMRRWRWAVSHVSALAFILFGLFGFEWFDFGGFGRFLHVVIWPFEVLALIVFPLSALLSFVLLHLDIRYRWYVITDRSLRIREGLWTVREMTISLANLQNVGLRQGPLERWFGVANVEVRTAGGGDKESGGDHAASMHVGLLRGIEDAATLRDEIVARWQHEQTRDAASDRANGALLPAEASDHALATLPDTPLDALRTAGAALVVEARALGDWARGPRSGRAAQESPVELANAGATDQGQRRS